MSTCSKKDSEIKEQLNLLLEKEKEINQLRLDKEIERGKLKSTIQGLQSKDPNKSGRSLIGIFYCYNT